ncbi:MAG TPA: restriction endonuclease subunit S [Flavobacteriaceae bacterium]|nr:restriction endonuclease subunit S [Flavobacteriaceae bacterium]
MEFKEYNLIECVSEIIDYRGKTPKKLGGEWDDNGDYRAISAKNIKNNKIVNEEAMKKVNKEIYMKWMKKEVKKGDILLTSEAPLGETYYWDSEEKIVLSQRIYGIRANENIIKSRYLFAYMQSRNFSHELTSRESGTTVTGIRQSELEKVKIKIPVLSIQKYIGDTIFNLNQKIQVNSEIINTLEKISQTLFKHWFIDFEFPNEEGKPYKSSGGEMVESELGEIPKGWSVKYLSENVDFLSGGTPKTKEESYWHGTIPFFTPKDAKNNLYTTTTEKSITDLGLEKCNSKLYPKNTLFITARGTVGKLALANRPMAMNQSCFALKHKDDKQFYLYNIVDNLVKEIILGANGAVFNAINLNDLKRLKYAYSNEQVIANFENTVSRFYEKMSLLEEENINLQQLRDTLLPKLLSGEIEIPDNLEV